MKKKRRYVKCSIEQFEIPSTDYNGRPIMVPSVCARCSECGHETQSFGTGGASVTRCLVVMREDCPRGQSNYYVAS